MRPILIGLTLALAATSFVGAASAQTAEELDSEIARLENELAAQSAVLPEAVIARKRAEIESKRAERAALDEKVAEEAGPVFELELYQGDAKAEITDHRATLDRAPFEFRIRLLGTEALYVHTAEDTAVLTQATDGQSLGETFRKYATIALSRNNESEALHLKDGASHQAWIVMNPELHTFNSLESTGDGWSGAVRISQVFIDGVGQPIGDTALQSLHFVFYAGELSTEEGAGQELQRDHLTVHFE